MDKCTIVLSKGLNKGKLCYEVNQKCRHKQFICLCGTEFSSDISYNRHRRGCDAQKTKVLIHTVPHDNHPLQQLVATGGSDTVNNSNNNSIIRGDCNNVVTINAICSDNYFEQLLEKMDGDRMRVINFITQAARKGSVYVLFHRLFVEGHTIGELPCVTFDKKDLIYILNEQLIRDFQAAILSGTIYNNAVNAVLKSTNELVARCLAANNLDELYDCYDLKAIQTNICDAEKLKRDISRRLMADVFTKFHPVFSKFNPLVIPELR